jgi:hypothetical protein
MSLPLREDGRTVYAAGILPQCLEHRTRKCALYLYVVFSLEVTG